MDRLRVCLSVCLRNVCEGGPFESLSVCVFINVGGVGGPFEGMSVCVSHKCGRCGWTV